MRQPGRCARPSLSAPAGLDMTRRSARFVGAGAVWETCPGGFMLCWAGRSVQIVHVRREHSLPIKLAPLASRKCPSFLCTPRGRASPVCAQQVRARVSVSGSARRVWAVGSSWRSHWDCVPGGCALVLSALVDGRPQGLRAQRGSAPRPRGPCPHRPAALGFPAGHARRCPWKLCCGWVSSAAAAFRGSLPWPRRAPEPRASGPRGRGAPSARQSRRLGLTWDPRQGAAQAPGPLPGQGT